MELPRLTVGSVKEVDPAVRDAAIRAAEDKIRKELGGTYELVEMGKAATVECLLESFPSGHAAVIAAPDQPAARPIRHGRCTGSRRLSIPH